MLKDAEATFVDTWTPFGFRLTMGQFKVPFGYEVLQSSADREMPERARVIRALFPGERDRGARLTARWEWFRFMGALVNGNFTQGDPVYITLRPEPLLGHLPPRRAATSTSSSSTCRAQFGEKLRDVRRRRRR